MGAPRNAATTHVPGAAAAASRGARLRQIVQVAVDRRRMLVERGLSRRNDHHMDLCRMRLSTWLERNPWPSDATVDAFPFAADVWVVMPTNGEGKKLLIELRRLLRL